MKIAIIGTRGIPANYGGFETFAEEMSVRLAQRGHEVTVYCRSNNIKIKERVYRGVRLVVLPTISNKYLDTVIHTFIATLHMIFTPVQVAYFCNPINAAFTIIPRICGKKTIINVDGLEWRRTKWNVLARTAHKASEYLATALPDVIVTDSHAVQDYYRKKFNKTTEYISYGADIKVRVPPGPVMEGFGLKERGYLLYVSRLEPENNAHILIKAYEKTKGDMPLVIVGDAPYNKKYINELKSTRDSRIRFVGSIYGEGCSELMSNAFAYIHGNQVGGTNPALLQAMASGNCVIVNGVDFNKEVIDDCGLWFKPNDPEDLKNKIEYLFDNPQEAERYRKAAVERVSIYYNWDAVVDKTEELMKRLLSC